MCAAILSISVFEFSWLEVRVMTWKPEVVKAFLRRASIAQPHEVREARCVIRYSRFLIMESFAVVFDDDLGFRPCDIGLKSIDPRHFASLGAQRDFAIEPGARKRISSPLLG